MDIPRIAFFGTPDIGVYVLDELEHAGIVPTIVITNPDAPRGRKLVLTETPVAAWARERGIPCLKPESPDADDVLASLRKSGVELFIIAAYGKRIPSAILALPRYGALNVHPSLLPALRGASPIRSAILENVNPTGVSIMVPVERMDAGPVVAREEVRIPESEWPTRGRTLDELLARRGGALLARILPDWISGTLTAEAQDESRATYAKKITKEMGEIDVAADPSENLRKIRAFDGWPGAYFFTEKGGRRIRVKIVDARLTDGSLVITRVIPEGKQEMDYETFLRS